MSAARQPARSSWRRAIGMAGLKTIAGGQMAAMSLQVGPHARSRARRGKRRRAPWSRVRPAARRAHRPISARNWQNQSLAAMPPSTRIAAARARAIGRHGRRQGPASEKRRTRAPLARGARCVASSVSPQISAARVRLPMRRAEPDECRHQVDAVTVRHLRRERRGLGGVLDQAEPVAQPLDRGPGDEDRAFHRIGRAPADAIGGRRQHAGSATARASSPVLSSRKQPVP